MKDSGKKRTDETAKEDVLKNEKSSQFKRFAVFAIALVMAFLLGFVPMWFNQRDALFQRDTAREHLRLSQMQNRLGSAMIDARRGEYEQARVYISDFFTDLRSEIDRSDSAFSNAQLEAIRPILANRDQTITLLARGDETAVSKLSEMHVEFRRAIDSATLPQNEK